MKPRTDPSCVRRWQRLAAFTLLEILLASLAAALIISAVYGIFSHALRLRDSGDQRIRAARLRARAEATIRADLRGAFISGGTLASVLDGNSTGTDTANLTQTDAGNIPGYLKFTTATGRDNEEDLYGDVQQVEYYVAADPASGNGGGGQATGFLMRVVTRDLLNATTTSNTTTANGSRTEAILAGVQSFQVSFYDGSAWQTQWQFTGLTSDPNSTSTTASTTTASASTSATSTILGQSGLPTAVRIDIQQAPATPRDGPPPPLEVLVPWTTQPFAAATPVPTTATSAPTPGGTSGSGNSGSGNSGNSGSTGTNAPSSNNPSAAPPSSGGGAPR